jgi:DNA polymerase III alpha subunit (gram-positive type)
LEQTGRITFRETTVDVGTGMDTLRKGDTVLNEFSSIINVPQHVRFNEQAVKVNGITRELSDQGRPAKEVITKFKEVFSQADLWAVYTSFDYDLMLRECRAKRY